MFDDEIARMNDSLSRLAKIGIEASDAGKFLRNVILKKENNMLLTNDEQKLAVRNFDIKNYEDIFDAKMLLVKDIAMKAANEYTSTYREGGKLARFYDIFRKFKRIEKEFLYGAVRKREKLSDDLIDLIVYCFVMWIYMDELDYIESEEQ